MQSITEELTALSAVEWIGKELSSNIGNFVLILHQHSTEMLNKDIRTNKMFLFISPSHFFSLEEPHLIYLMFYLSSWFFFFFSDFVIGFSLPPFIASGN